MQSVLNSKDFKDSYLSLKDYLTMKKNQNDLHIVEAFNMYLKSRDLRAESIANYKRMFKLHVLPYFENVKCNNVTEAFVRSWIDKLQKKIKYVDKIFILMKNIFRLLKEKKYVVRNVFLEIDYKISYKTHKYKKLDSISENDLKALLNVDFVNKKYKTHIKDTLLFKMVLFTIYTALRLKNVVMLEWKHIDFEKKLLRLKGSEMKNKQDFILPLNSGAIAILKEMQKCKISNFVFDRNLASHKIYISNVIKALKECKKALKGIEWKRGDRRQLFLQVAKKYNLDSKFANKYFYSKVKLENLESSFKTYKNTTKASQNTFKQVISEMVKRKLNINLHCIRKAFSTILNEKGLEHNIHKYIIDSCLAHSTMQGSEGSYNFATYELMKKS
ncbi:tyrosine-type recombinase/integrase [Helicobacter saguini]|uniref:Tyrosine-type recombinase/integrase n=1 Tax=Helicobacter saguini TaxID=1548018 RepID=A0A347W076_9HELI|nr:tyrosine-type recombinase/integrase [Helicobacter saguini]MWV62872.1 tyrosine-type recombinase/integrase [Helicobacter saguini]MWV66458.1 tyrosine-type recombinase/integrase [Helicobacter saguini]MWV68807.1 tyrosine-type recombinase/integrase [Helicobacter saguini]MWV71638.1 tyrosine-type recombinase/integrase [Helicobacter saguini]TLD94441.1 hypothetical protein LS64_005800 [Helicobacter saguini]